MHLPRRRRPDFPEVAPFDDPQRLRETIAHAPNAAGVYCFHGDASEMPLYIGKSVNLRSRLLAHLRNPQEASLLRQTRHISFIRTAGEMGALLLEAQLIKRLKPMFNQKLRETRQLCSLQSSGTRVSVVFSGELDFAAAPDLYGLFGSRKAALQALRDLADLHRLCEAVMGLEKHTPGRACFRAGIARCAGACLGGETPDAHQRRLMEALRPLHVKPWPCPGAIGVYESDEELSQIHVVHRWHYIGTTTTWESAHELAAAPAAFDADVYKILAPRMTEGRMAWRAL